MNILAIADRPPRQPIGKTLEENTIDPIVTLGDLELDQIRELESISSIPKLGVYGNHDSGNYMDSLGIQNMHLKTATVQGVVFGGFDGSVRYKNSDAPMYTQEEAEDLMRDFPGVDVFLAHCPPYGINDEPEELAHAGFVVLRKYIEQKHPKYFLHGHTYPTEQGLVSDLLSTKIFYIFEDRIISI